MSKDKTNQPPDWIMELAVTLTKHLQGKTIAVVRYTSDEEDKLLGFKHKAPLITFTDDTILIPCYGIGRSTKSGEAIIDAGEFITNIDGIRSIPSL